LLHTPLNILQTEQDMQCTHNTTCGILHNVYTSPAVITTWCYFTETNRVYGKIYFWRQQWSYI